MCTLQNVMTRVERLETDVCRRDHFKDLSRVTAGMDPEGDKLSSPASCEVRQLECFDGHTEGAAVPTSGHSRGRQNAALAISSNKSS